MKLRHLHIDSTTISRDNAEKLARYQCRELMLSYRELKLLKRLNHPNVISCLND
jgi:hypothetical protein